MRRIALASVAILCIGTCGGDSPTAPSPPPPANIVGNWTGTMASNEWPALLRSTSLRLVGLSTEPGPSLQMSGPARSLELSTPRE